MKPVLAIVALALPVLLSPRPASACSLPAPVVHALDSAYAADTTPPSAVTGSASITRHRNASSSCFDIAYTYLTLSATDDAAPPERLGFKLAFVSGELPDGMTLPTDIQVGNPQLFFNYRDESGFSFELEVRAVDLNGNLGPPTLLLVEESPDDLDDDGGCSTGNTPGAALALLALAFVRRRRR